MNGKIDRGSLVAVCVFALFLKHAQAQNRDLTNASESFAASVVDATVQHIRLLTRENGNLRTDRMLIRRIARVETEDGNASFTYSDRAYHGGIWRVSRAVFNVTQEMYRNDAYGSIFLDITQLFGIHWNQATWKDCRKPLFSALAARLYFHNLQPRIPQNVIRQARLWKNFHDEPPVATVEGFVSRVRNLESGGCEARGLDLVFVMDSSRSVGSQNFGTAMNFVAGVVDSFDIGPDRTRVGVIEYSTNVMVAFHLDEYMDKASLEEAILNVTYSGDYTYTVDALETMVNESFHVDNGARPADRGLPRVAVIITDGRSNQPGDNQVAVPADRAREMGITIFAIGVTSNVDDDELNAIANDPSDTYVFNVANFNVMDSISASLRDLTCNQPGNLIAPSVNGRLDAGQRNYLQRPVHEEGITLSITAPEGNVVMYVSTTKPNPNDALYDFRLDATEGEGTAEVFVGPEHFSEMGNGVSGQGGAQVGRRQRQVPSQNDTLSGTSVGTVYITIEGLQPTSEFTLTVDDGDTTEQTETTPRPPPASGCDSVFATAENLAVILLCAAHLIAVHLY